MRDTIKINLHYGGVMEQKENSFKYERGSVKNDIEIDPDFMTWSMFDAFCEDNGLGGGLVEQVWYKLPQEDMGLLKTISELGSDGEITKMCTQAITVGEVDVFIEQRVSPITNDGKDGRREAGKSSGCENERGEDKGGECDDDSDIGDDQAPNNAGGEAEEEIIEEGGDDMRFLTFMDDIRNEEALGLPEVIDNVPAIANEAYDNHIVDDEAELERQCRDAEQPAPAVETDDEWEAFNRTEREISRTRYSKEKPPYLWLMQTFKSGEEFKEQLLRYVLKTNFDVKLCRWEKTKLAAICRKEKCKWKIYCSVEKPKGKWMVKTYVDEHNHMKSSKGRMLKQGIVAMLFKDEARRRPGIKWTDIKNEIMMRYNLSVSKWICSKARRIALNMVIETQKEQFAKLWDYEAELRRSNENTMTEIVTIPRHDGKLVFDRFYISFENLRNSWKRCCRPIIGLDGAFMKWELKGEILAAVGRDADNRIYPFVWAIVRVEDNDSWAWFVDRLKTGLGLGLGNGYTVISDKQKGLINAVKDLLPNAEHIHCARHIFANWKKVYGMIEYEDYFWAVARSSSKGDYQYNMSALKAFDEVAYKDLLRTEPHTWCKAFFSSQARCDDVCNNLSESFNRTIKEARKLPLINMLEEIRRLAMSRISRRRDMTRKCESKFPPHIMEIFEQNRTDSELCKVLKSSESLYEVVEQDCSYEVCLPYKHCACNQWNITGIPCRHAIHVITELNRDPEDYVDDYYLTSKWQDTYSDNIKPVNGERLWEKTGKDPIQVPDKRRMPGRPKNYDRIKEAHESKTNPTKATREGRTVTCRHCKQTGHNKGTCTGAAAVETVTKRKRGRPSDDDPWSIQNAPKKRRNAKSRSTPAPTPTENAQSQSTQNAQSQSTENAQSQSTQNAPTSTQIAQSQSTENGPIGPAPRSRGRGRTRELIPRGYGCYISPYTGRIFDVWGSSATDMNGPFPQPREDP